ncbi:GNAT family N-acetyltransferase, partial [Salsipaludibacter albus]|uniref:GNAT family N-acetyltransferase n=1 Tax=Salsipaludibacter albus TaxID=2849650 RepID=UPI001EE4B83D
AEWQQRFRDRVVDGPHLLLVAEVDGRVVGYAETSPFRPHHAYAASFETSIYTAPGIAGKGVGSRLYEALFDRLAQ